MSAKTVEVRVSISDMHRMGGAAPAFWDSLVTKFLKAGATPAELSDPAATLYRRNALNGRAFIFVLEVPSAHT